MEFRCTKCGACCRSVKGIRELEDLGYVMPDGSCVMLLPDNTCHIYETRPDICRVNVMGERMGIPEEKWHAINYNACEKLQAIQFPKRSHSDESGEPAPQ